MPAMHYELFMSAALGEARSAAAAGDRPQGAVAVLDEALVAAGHDEVLTSGDPTAHAVLVTLREVARRLGTHSLRDVIVFSVSEPCPMCVGALLECDVDGLVYALPDPVTGAAGSVVQLAQAKGLPRRLSVVSGILAADAADLLAELAAEPGRAHGPAHAGR